MSQSLNRQQPALENCIQFVVEKLSVANSISSKLRYCVAACSNLSQTNFVKRSKKSQKINEPLHELHTTCLS